MTGVVSGKGHLTGCGLLGTVLFLFSQSGFKCFSFYVAHGLNLKCLDSGSRGDQSRHFLYETL